MSDIIHKNAKNVSVLLPHFTMSERVETEVAPDEENATTIIHPPWNSGKKIRYRNKTNLVFGMGNLEHGIMPLKKMVGIYRHTGSRILEPVERRDWASRLAIQFARYLTVWINDHSQYDVYDYDKNDGLWRCFTIRETRHNDVMLIIHVNRHPELDRWIELEFPLVIQYLSNIGAQLRDQIQQFAPTPDISDLSSLSSSSSSSSSSSNSASEEDEIGFDLKSVYYQITENSKEMTRYDEHFHQWGDEYMTEHMDDKVFRISPGAFFQVNYLSGRHIYRTLRNWITANPNYANSSENTIMWDLCCGTGVISIYLGELFARCVGIDSNEFGIEDALWNMKNNRFPKCTSMEFITGKVEEVFASVYQRHKEEYPSITKGCIVINPPRRGIYPVVMRTIHRMTQEQDIPSIYYISCYAESLKRDLDVFFGLPGMREKYWVKQMITIDQFPGTDHSEVIIEISKKSLIIENPVR
jgi:tRNA/tmRNA/rRNA uracil-C5-methylase (TrmA/RlmC/RlmD family)